MQCSVLGIAERVGRYVLYYLIDAQTDKSPDESIANHESTRSLNM